MHSALWRRTLSYQKRFAKGMSLSPSLAYAMSTGRPLQVTCYGQDLPQINAFGDSYKKIGTVWTQSISVPDQTHVYTAEYPPSILDESAIALPNYDGVAFNNQNNARHALLWWIICTVPSVSSRRSWAKELLGEHMSALLLVVSYSKAWCSMLSQDTNGSFWIEYNGRKFVLA